MRVGFTLGRFHDLADQKAEDFVVTRAVLFDLLGIGREHLIDRRLDTPQVRHLFQSFFTDDLLRRFAAIQQRFEDALGDLTADLALIDQLHQLG